MALHISVDIGGTFTDVVARDDAVTVSTKVPTTPDNLVEGVRHGIMEVFEKLDRDRDEVARIIHGTTAGTNAAIEREGGTVGLLTTKGFRDVLAIGRQKRRDMYDLFLEPQTPTFLAPRHRRYEIEERMDRDGNVLIPLDELSVIEAIDELVCDHNVDSIAICYLFSCINPINEVRTVDLISEKYPNIFISRSSNINPQFREYERLVVTLFDAYLRPVIEEYVAEMTDMLKEEGINVELQIMQSRGGITNSDLILEKPVTTVLSGPAAGVVGAAAAGSQGGHNNLITLDMGGTSSDVSLVHEGQPHISSEGEIIDYPLRLQMIDINAIGSGGGSIASINESGNLRVGPISSGADPGPACYDRGGFEPTVTDASVVLGYLNPEYFAGGALKLNVTAAEKAISSRIAKPLDLDLMDAAKGIHDIINTQIAEQIRLNTVNSGHDPREFILFTMGGAGPTHGAKVAEELGVDAVLIPPNPGVLSASGLHAANIEHDYEQALAKPINALTPQALNAVYEELNYHGNEAMEREDIPTGEVKVKRQADVRYRNQSFEIPIPIPDNLDKESFGKIREEFHARHNQVYGHHNPNDTIEIVNVRVIHTYQPEKMAPVVPNGGSSVEDAAKGTRSLEFIGRDEPINVSIYDRSKLPAGAAIDGPAVVEQSDTTTLIYPGQDCNVDERGNLLIYTNNM